MTASSRSSCVITIFQEQRLRWSGMDGWSTLGGLALRIAKLVQPDAIFRLASVSKPITAVATLKLVEDGKLDLGARVFRDLLAEIGPHRASDSRTNSITVRDLLRHSGGFDWARSGDPQFMQSEISRKSRESTPLNCVDIITYMKSQRLDFSPGDRHAYSNYGYCVLGRVIERASGAAYEDYVREEILIPAGAVRMRVADPFLSGRIANEVKYYDYPGAARSRSLDPEVRSRVARPYDGYLSTMDAHGGWAGSVVDVLRFVVAVDGRGDDDVISAESIAVMIAPQRLPPFERGPVWYGLGWMVRDLGSGESNWWHAGGMPGTSSLIVRAGNGFAWAAAMNSRPENADEFHLALDIAMWEAFQQATRWPRHDLFPQFE